MKDIARELKVSKASISLWVRDIILSEKQKESLSARGVSVAVIEKRRVNRIRNTQHRHRAIIEKAKEKIDILSKRDLLLVGATLYWGEGGKTKTGMARVANSDPNLIRLMVRFFKEIFDVPAEKFRGHVHTFSHLNAIAAEKYWSEISGVPRSQFYKTYSKPSTASLSKKDTLPYGTFDLQVCDTTIFLTIMGWIEKLSELGGNQ